MTGIVIIDKPAGWTSMDVCAKLRRALREKRVGHGGTLDPMATGVLPVFFGRATRAVQFFEHARKRYVAGIRFGMETDTQDITGEILKSCEAAVTERELVDIIPKFLGRQMQVPPMYSAVKVGGKKLYELAREGKTVERKAREIEIESIEIVGRRDGDFLIDVACSKGSYIRTLCADIGAALGCGAAMSSLRRTAAGTYTEAESITLEDFLKALEEGTADRHILTVDSVFAEYPEVRIESTDERKCRVGGEFKTDAADGLYRVYGGDGFLMLGEARSGVMKTVKNFFEV